MSSASDCLIAEGLPHYNVMIRAADELYFGDTLLSHPFHLHASHHRKQADDKHEENHGKEKGHKGHKGEKHKDTHHSDEHHSHGKGKKHGELHQAILDAKNMVNQALEELDDVTPDSLLADMRKEISLLTKGNIELKSELDKLRRDFRNLCDFVYGKRGTTGQAQHSATSQPKTVAEGDEDFDLFGSSDEEEDAEKERIKQERLKAYAEKKAKKPAQAAKSSVILDVKPWDDTTDMAEMEKLIREIERDGLVWGAAKLIPLAYGIKKLQIICVVEDEKVSVDDLIDQITDGLPDHVQSVDIAAFNKI